MGISRGNSSFTKHGDMSKFQTVILVNGFKLPVVRNLRISGIPVRKQEFALIFDISKVCKKNTPKLMRQIHNLTISATPDINDRLRQFIHSRLIPSIIGPAMPILANSGTAIKDYDHLVADTLKESFALCEEISRFIIEKLFGLVPTRLIALEFLVRRITEYPAPHLIPFYLCMIEKIECNYADRLQL